MVWGAMRKYINTGRGRGQCDQLMRPAIGAGDAAEGSEEGEAGRWGVPAASDNCEEREKGQKGRIEAVAAQNRRSNGRSHSD